MSKFRKTLKVTSIVIVVIFAVIGIGIWGFVSSIKNQRTCEWANIDNIELHAHVDIPKITTSDCNYDKVTNTKMAFFQIDKIGFDDSRYVRFNQLKKISSISAFEHETFLNIDEESIIKSELYYKSNYINEEVYYVLFDRTNSRLWVTVKYKD